MAEPNVFSRASEIRSILTRDIFSVQVYLDEIMFDLADRTGLAVDMEGNYIRIHMPMGADADSILGQIRITMTNFLKRNARLICGSLTIWIKDHRQAYADACAFPEWIYDTIISPTSILIRF